VPVIPPIAGERNAGRDASRRPSRRAGLAALLTVIVAGLCAFFFSEGIPFFFEDLEFIDASAAQTHARIAAQILTPLPQSADFGFLDRPVEFLCLKLLHDSAGYTSGIFHAFKACCALLVAALIAAWLSKATRTVAFPVLTGFWLVSAAPVYISYLWICDFEIVSQVFVVGALILWWMVLSNRCPSVRRQSIVGAAIVCLAYLGSKTKAGALVIPAAIVLSALPFGRRAVWRAAAIAGVSALATCVPRFVVAEGGLHERVAWRHIREAFPQLIQTAGMVPMALGFGICAMLIIGCVYRRAAAAQGGRADVSAQDDGAAMSAVLIAWTVSAILLWALLPHIETRYLAGAVTACLATIGFAGASAAAHRRSSRLSRILAAVMAVVVVFQIGANLWLDVQYRGYWGSHFISINQIITHVDRHYRHAAVLYRHNRRAFYSPTPSAGNRYVRLAEQEMAQAGLAQRTDGVIVAPDRYADVLLVGFISPDPRMDTNRLCRVSGTGETRFDHWIEALNIPIRSFNAMSLSTKPDQHAYPCVGYVGPVRKPYRQTPAQQPPPSKD
jgi:hypothetical protein